MPILDYNAGEKEVSDAFQPIPKGTYDLKIVNVVLGESKKSGYPQATVDFKVVNNPDHEGRLIKFHYVTLIPDDQNGAFIAKGFLKALGQPYKGRVQVDTDAWVGKILTADVIIEPYNGNEYNKVKNVRHYEGAILPPGKDDGDVPF